MDAEAAPYQYTQHTAIGTSAGPGDRVPAYPHAVMRGFPRRCPYRMRQYWPTYASYDALFRHRAHGVL